MSLVDYYEKLLPAFYMASTPDGKVCHAFDDGKFFPMMIGGKEVFLPSTFNLRDKDVLSKGVIFNPLFHPESKKPQAVIVAALGSAAFHINLRVSSIATRLLAELLTGSTAAKLSAAQVSKLIGSNKLSKTCLSALESITKAGLEQTPRALFVEPMYATDIFDAMGESVVQGYCYRFPLMEKLLQGGMPYDVEISKATRSVLIQLLEEILPGSKAIAQAMLNSDVPSKSGYVTKIKGTCPFLTSAIRHVDLLMVMVKEFASEYDSLFTDLSAFETADIETVISELKAQLPVARMIGASEDESEVVEAPQPTRQAFNPARLNPVTQSQVAPVTRPQPQPVAGTPARRGQSLSQALTSHPVEPEPYRYEAPRGRMVGQQRASSRQPVGRMRQRGPSPIDFLG